MIRIMKTKFLTTAGLLALVCVLVCPASRADGVGDLTITNLSAITGDAGSSLTVFGDLTNTSLSQLNFNNDTPTFNTALFTGIGDLTFNGIVGSGPAVIAGSTTIDHVDLFTFSIDPAAASGVYDFNNYTVYGGTDAGCNSGDCNSRLGIINFSVTVNGPLSTPEPGSIALLASGLLLGLLALRRAGR